MLFALANVVLAQPAPPPQVIPLWPEGVPDARVAATPEVVSDARVSNVHVPTLTVFAARSDRRTRTAVIVCPGGGYRRLAIEKEGAAVADWLNSIGVSAFVLKYRLKEYGHPAPLRDVLRAVRLVRSEASRWDIDAHRIGVLGFSAGGHLAASAGTLFDSQDGRTGGELDTVSARPDFLVLVYPVITLDGPLASATSREGLLGPSPDPTMVDRLSLQLRVTSQAPPTFLVHGGTDRSVPPENSLMFYEALRRAGVPAELHAYERGDHGIALEPGHGPMSQWPGLCEAWLAARGLLTRTP